ncbi:MAG: DNA polymerase III subunit alpha [Thermocrinis sp.]|nr:DNA polymerase III subunit alpha [Thermocrinis sp.]
MTDFVHLHLHTQYSLLDGAIKIKDLASKAKEFGYSAVAVTDHGNLFGILDFYKNMKEQGIKPLLGMEAYFTTGSRFDRKGKGSEDNITDRYNHHLILIAKNDVGLKNLYKLSSLAFKEGFYYKPRIDYELLSKYSEGLIALTACIKGVPTYYASIGEVQKAEDWVKKFKDIFGEDLYLELQVNSLPEQEIANRHLVEIGKKLGVKLVATGDAHYLLPEDRIAHQVLMAVQMKKTLNELQKSEFKCANENLHFASPQEMWERFKGKFDGWEKALLNTLEVAEKCQDRFEVLENKGYLLPSFSENSSEAELLKELAIKGLKQRIEQGLVKDSKEYWDRLEYELSVVEKMGFAGYFLIVQDFINWAKGQKIPVGPGRGSAAGSLLAFALGITDVDPIKHGLLFERFLNPERVSMPDIDVDFCMENRDRVLEYVREKYGAENTAKIITYNVMKAKQTLRDTARALGLPYSEADKLAKLIPPGDVQGTWLSLEEMLLTPIEELLEKYGKHRNDIETNAKKLRKLAQENPEIKKLLEIALRLEGLTRHTSLHAAGVVISPVPLEELVPLYYDDGELATQFDMAKLEEVGLVKMDFLGLKTLTELEKMRQMVAQRHGKEIEFLKLPLDDPKVYELLKKGLTSGVFQLESSGMKNLLKRLEPDNFDDIVAVLALYRPGPLKSGLVDSYINRKHGREPIEYPFPELEPVLKETYGVWVYQEQIMKASQILAGFTPGEADTLRKAIGKKKKEVMQEMREKFIKGAVERGYPEKKIVELWEDIEKFASYSFNKSHSVAYGYLSYWTAYMKVYYPEEFFAVKFSMEKSDRKFINIINDARTNFGIQILPPDINKSDADFVIEDRKKIRFGLARIKGVGEETARLIVSKRNGKWKSLADFVKSVKVNKKVLEALIKAGAFDFTGMSRTEMLSKLSEKDSLYSTRGLFQTGQKVQEDQSKYEREVLGFYLAQHPLDPYEKLLSGKVMPLENIEDLEEGEYTFAGVISELKVKKNSKGSLYAVFNLIDKTGIGEVVLWPEIYEENKERLKDDELVVVHGTLVEDQETETLKIIAKEIYSVEEFLSNKIKYVRIKIQRELTDKELESLYRAVSLCLSEKGAELLIECRLNGKSVLMQADPRYRLEPKTELYNLLRDLPVEVSLEL